MDSVNSAGINTNYGSYTEYESASSGALIETGGVTENNSAVSDSSSIGSFGSGIGDGELNDLYNRQAQTESELGEITAQKNEVQTQVNARRQELVHNRQQGEEFAQENEQTAEAQEAYNQAVSERDKAQQDLNQIRQESSANDQAINSKAQQRQSVSVQLSSAQSQLASLQPPAKSGSGEDGDANANYEAEYSAYEAQKSALESQITGLQQQLEQLRTETQQLQNTKTQLDRQLNGKQSEVLQLDAAFQTAQRALDEYYKSKADSNDGIENDFAMDSELKELESELQELQRQEAEKKSEAADINARIAEAEANDEGLQTVREEAADQAFKEAAAQTGFDADGAEAAARSAAAQKQYGMSYDELTEEEKLSIEARVDGEVTLEAMDLARQKLEEDPDNAAAQAVIELGAKSLDAQTQLAQIRFNNSMENLPESLRDGAAAAVSEARSNDGEGEDTDAAAMDALAQYIAENLKSAELSPEDFAALESIGGALDAYAAVLENADKGAEIVGKASESFAKSELAAMKADLAMQLGVSPDQLIVLSGTDKDEVINISNDEDGGLYVAVGDSVYHYTAEEARLLIIDGGAGNDTVKAADDVTQSLHIFGGAGNDRISGGAGDDLIYGGSGDDYLQGLAGNDMVSGGSGSDKIFGGNNYWDEYDDDAADTLLEDDGNDILLGGDGNDEIDGGDGNDYMDGGAGRDELWGGDGDDLLLGGSGSDIIYGENGNDYIDGGDGHDSLYGDYNVPHSDEDYYSGGNDVILGGKGDDHLNGGAGDDLLLGEDGEDILEGGRGSDMLDGGQDNDQDEVYGYGRCGVDPDSDSADLAITNYGQRDIVNTQGQVTLPQGYLTRADFSTDKIDIPADGFDYELHQDLKEELEEVFQVMNDVYDCGSDIGKKLVGGGFATKKVYSGVSALYNVAKVSVSRVTGVFGAYTAITGIIDAAKGWDTADGWQKASWCSQIASGGCAVAAMVCCSCPVAAPVLLAASGIFALVHLGIDIFH